MGDARKERVSCDRQRPKGENMTTAAIIIILISFLAFQFFGAPNVNQLKSKRNIKGLIKALGYKKDASIRVAAAEALLRIGGDAIKALEEKGAPDAVEPLRTILMNDNEVNYLRQAAAEVLVKISADDPVDKDVLRMALFGEISTDDPDESIQVLFEKALLTAPILPTHIIEQQFDDVRRAWGSNGLVNGPMEEMRALVLENIKRYKKEVPQFEGYAVACVIHARAAQVMTLFGNSFIPIRIWRAANSVYVCGSPNFKETGKPWSQ